MIGYSTEDGAQIGVRSWPSRLGALSRLGPGGWLLVVAIMFVVILLLNATPTIGLGLDETIYTSQVSQHAPAAFFNAARARGVSLLVAPVSEFTSSTVVLRLYLSALSGAGLWAAFRIWLMFRKDATAVLAAALYGGLWVAGFYGNEVMPDHWSALACVAADGCFLLVVRDSNRTATAGLSVAIALAALIRPPDAVWLVAPLLGAVLVVGAWRRWMTALAICGGAVVGLAPWLVESYVRFGGVFTRLHTTSLIQGGLGLQLAFGDQARSANGPLLCRPCTVGWKYPELSAWWFVLPLLVVAGVLIAWRTGRMAMAVVPAVCGISVSLTYMFLLSYAAPRFLLPAYALLSVPSAVFLRWLAVDGKGWLARWGTPIVVVCLAGNLIVQQGVLWATIRRETADRRDTATMAADLKHLGIRGQCLINGDEAEMIAFYAGCASAQTTGNDVTITPTEFLLSAHRHPTAIIVEPGDNPLPAWARDWRRQPLVGLRTTQYRGSTAYLPPWPLPPS